MADRFGDGTGALIPVAPFLFLDGLMAIWCAFVLAMLSHFAVGAARSLFTGRGLLRSGLEMLAVGMGIAVVSTPQGLMSGHDARRKNLGGELLFKVW